jgi:hypothetical protein
MSLLSSAPARVAVVVGLGVFRPLTQYRERRVGAAFGGLKPLAYHIEHGGVGDLEGSARPRSHACANFVDYRPRNEANCNINKLQKLKLSP